MATSQPPMQPGAGPRPPAGQGPPPNMVLHGQHPSLAPMMPQVAHFAAQQGNYPTQIPLQHQRPMMNGIPGAHPNFPAMQHNQNAALAAQAHLQRLQQNGPLGPMTQAAFPPQLQPGMHPQQIQQQIQRYQQQNPGMRVLPPQHLIQQQPVAGPAIQHMSAPQQPVPRGNMPLQRFALFAWQLGGPSPAKTKEVYWHKFVQEWFVQTAALRLVLAEGHQGRKEFELPYSLIHHFFHSIHASGVRQMNMMLGAAPPQAELPSHIFECPGASILYRFDNGAQVLWEGSIRVQFKAAGTELKIERLEIVNDEHTEFVPRKIAKQQLTPPLSNRSTSPDAKRSPMERNTLSQMSGEVRGGSDHGEISLPRTDINEMGVPAHLMRFLEVAEIFVYICPLIDFSRTKEVSPLQALQAYPISHPSKQFQNPNTFMHPSQVSQMGSPLNDMSPLAGHASLPIAGITSSPQPHYPSPMSSQTSQTGAAGPNTTPLMSHRQAPSSAPKTAQANKRRRGSAVQNMTMKEEDEELGSKHPKQSPRIGTGRGGAPTGPPGKRLRSDG